MRKVKSPLDFALCMVLLVLRTILPHSTTSGFSYLSSVQRLFRRLPQQEAMAHCGAQQEINDNVCQHVFCYGSLRPDDDSGMPWTKQAVKGLRAQPAMILGAKLYWDTYASLVFNENTSEMARCINVSKKSSVIGWVLTADHDVFQEKMKSFDQIEGYEEDGSGLYQRVVAKVCLGDPKRALGGKAIGAEGTYVSAYVYHRPDCSKEHQIISGDWLKRGSERH